MSHAKRLNFIIVSPQGKTTLEALWVEITAPNGRFVIGPGHMPLLSLVSNPSTIAYKTGQGEPVSMECTGGIIMVEENEVTFVSPRDNSKT